MPIRSHKMIMIISIIFLTFILLSLTTTLYSCPSKDNMNLSEKITFLGTDYVNCRISPDYPFPTDREIITIKGEVSEIMGSRTFPWIAAFVADRVLFDPATGDLITNYKMLLGEEVKIKGYSGVGEIVMHYPFNKEQIEIIKFDNAFFVTEIIGWTKIEGYPVNKDTGEKNKLHAPVIFWIDNHAAKATPPEG